MHVTKIGQNEKIRNMSIVHDNKTNRVIVNKYSSLDIYDKEMAYIDTIYPKSNVLLLITLDKNTLVLCYSNNMYDVCVYHNDTLHVKCSGHVNIGSLHKYHVYGNRILLYNDNTIKTFLYTGNSFYEDDTPNDFNYYKLLFVNCANANLNLIVQDIEEAVYLLKYNVQNKMNTYKKTKKWCLYIFEYDQGYLIINDSLIWYEINNKKVCESEFGNCNVSSYVIHKNTLVLSMRDGEIIFVRVDIKDNTSDKNEVNYNINIKVYKLNNSFVTMYLIHGNILGHTTCGQCILMSNTSTLRVLRSISSICNLDKTTTLQNQVIFYNDKYKLILTKYLDTKVSKHLDVKDACSFYLFHDLTILSYKKYAVCICENKEIARIDCIVKFYEFESVLYFHTKHTVYKISEAYDTNIDVTSVVNNDCVIHDDNGIGNTSGINNDNRNDTVMRNDDGNDNAMNTDNGNCYKSVISTSTVTHGDNGNDNITVTSNRHKLTHDRYKMITPTLILETVQTCEILICDFYENDYIIYSGNSKLSTSRTTIDTSYNISCIVYNKYIHVSTYDNEFIVFDDTLNEVYKKTRDTFILADKKYFYDYNNKLYKITETFEFEEYGTYKNVYKIISLHNEIIVITDNCTYKNKDILSTRGIRHIVLYNGKYYGIINHNKRNAIYEISISNTNEYRTVYKKNKYLYIHTTSSARRATKEVFKVYNRSTACSTTNLIKKSRSADCSNTQKNVYEDTHLYTLDVAHDTAISMDKGHATGHEYTTGYGGVIKYKMKCLKTRNKVAVRKDVLCIGNIRKVIRISAHKYIVLTYDSIHYIRVNNKNSVIRMTHVCDAKHNKDDAIVDNERMYKQRNVRGKHRNGHGNMICVYRRCTVNGAMDMLYYKNKVVYHTYNELYIEYMPVVKINGIIRTMDIRHGYIVLLDLYRGFYVYKISRDKVCPYIRCPSGNWTIVRIYKYVNKVYLILGNDKYITIYDTLLNIVCTVFTDEPVVCINTNSIELHNSNVYCTTESNCIWNIDFKNI